MNPATPAAPVELALSDEQRQIAAAVDLLLERESASAAVRRAAYDGDGFDLALWRHLADLGACAIRLPEAHGGLGLGLAEQVLVAEALGRRLACVPWLESAVLAGALLLLLDDATASARWLPGLADGSLIATVDVPPLGAPSGAALRARRGAGGWRVDGRLPALPAALAAQTVFVLLDSDDGPLLAALALHADGLRRSARRSHDATRPHASLTLHDVALADADVLRRGAAALALIDALRCVGALALAAEQVGVAQQCLDLSVAYLQQRVQFGRALAGFQALKHRCAQMMVAVELARSAVYGAARGIDAGVDAHGLLRLAAMARCQADAAAQYCAQEAIQLHGGVGFTWDYDPQMYFKRAQAARAWLGPPSAWRERVAADWFDRGSR